MRLLSAASWFLAVLQLAGPDVRRLYCRIVSADRAGQGPDEFQVFRLLNARLAESHLTRSAALAFAFSLRQISIIISAALQRALWVSKSSCASASRAFFA